MLYKMLKRSLKISNFYNPDVIEVAINDCKEIAQISLNGDDLEVSWNTEEDIEFTFNEFMNYTLSLLNETN